MKSWIPGLCLSLALTLPTYAQPQPEPVAAPAPETSPTPGPASSPTPAPAVEEEENDFQFRGYSSFGYSKNLVESPIDGINKLRGYDFADNKVKLDVLELDFRYALDKSERLGFRLDLTGGGSMPRVDSAAGLFRDPYTGLSNTSFDIRQAFLSYTVDEESKVRIDAGKFATMFGFEVMDGVDGSNWNATRTYSYTYSPYTHTGLRVTAPVNDWLTLTGVAVLGADNFQDTNQRLSYGGQILVKPNDQISMAINYLDGPEQIRNNHDRRRLVDFVGSWQVHDQVWLGGHYVNGSERLNGTVQTWNGLVLYVRAALSDDFFLNVRQEWWNDPSGIRTGVPVHIRSFTITPEYNIDPETMIRADFRFDLGDNQVFQAGSLPTDVQNTMMLNFVRRF